MRRLLLILLLVLAFATVGAKRSKPVTIVFDGLDAPATLAEKQVVRSTSSMTIDGVEHPVGFVTLARDGDLLGEHRIGRLIAHDGAPITWPGGADRLCTRADGATLQLVDGAIHLVTHHECQPAVVYDTTLAQAEDGALTAVSAVPIDAAAVGGIGNACAASPSPWGTHLGSEEYEADVRLLQPDGTVAGNDEGYNYFSAYFRGTLHGVHPYALGWIPEIDVATTPATVTKHFAMGRFSHEQAIVLPDQRTVYLSDDGTNNALFLFVADAAGDLSAGTLYAARFTQQDDAFSLDWISLGHATNDQVAPHVGGVPFDSLFVTADAKPGECPEGLTGINTSAKHECLAVQPGQELLASRLETRRYAALRGATTELRKAEGIAWDPDHGRVYMAVSAVARGMTAGHKKWDAGRDSGDHIRLAKNRCGVIYGGEVAAKTKDTDGARIDSKYVLGGLRPFVTGVPEGERCAIDAMANPDNVAWIPRARVLLIAEDTDHHDSNVLWAADLATEPPTLTRLMTTPLGAELAGINWFPDVGGWGYLTVNVQNPYSVNPWTGASYEGGIPEGANRSYLGVLGPFPQF